MSERVPDSQADIKSPGQLLDAKFPGMSSFNWEVLLALSVIDVGEDAQRAFCEWLTFDHVSHVSECFTSGGRAAVKVYILMLLDEVRRAADVEHALSSC
jgi:hypothetical protein